MDQEKSSTGDWKCIRILGKGSFGVVRLWKSTKTGKLNAAKEFDIQQFPYQQQITEKRITEMQKLWQKEVELMHSIIDCPHIVSAVPVPEDPSFSKSPLPILFLEYCSGGDLRQVLKRPENICGLREKDALTVFDHLAKAISYLHEKKIIHRDLKPDNILIHYDSSNQITYKLSDLGFAKDLSNNQTGCSTFVGTVQYLAPEIYMGKKYDKTVDYWSFGIIAYEITCGLRPFLHGEPQPTWFPLVENKGKDIISIYRNGEGSIAFSNTIPFYTHFSDVMKQCLVVWLRTMLQLDPTKRGKRIDESKTGANSSSSPEVVNLKLLEHLLATKFLQIHTAKKKLAYPIGTHTTIAEIQQRIAVETGLVPENQLILTIDGVQIQKTDLASKYLEMDLYLISRCPDLIRLKIKFPTTVNSFLSQWDTMKDPIKLRKVWSCAIFFVQSESLKVEIVKKSTEALKAWCTFNYTNQLKAFRNEIEKAAASLCKILELEGRLEEIDKQCSEQLNTAHEEDQSKSGCRFWGQEMTTLQNFYSSCLDNWVENVVLKPVRTTEMEEIYHKILKVSGDWKSSESTSSPFSYNELLKRSVCQFLVQRDQIDDTLLHNIKIQLEKIKSDAKLIDEMKSVITKLEQLTFDVMQRRCAKQSSLIQKLNEVTPINGQHSVDNNNGSKKEGSPAYATVQPKSPNPYSVRGGGYRSPLATLMTQSSALPEKKKDVGQVAVMAASLNSGLKTSIQSQYPMINKLMEESRILKSQTESGLKSLNDSLEELQEILSENNGI